MLRCALLTVLACLAILMGGSAQASNPTTAYAKGGDLVVNGMVVAHFERSSGSEGPHARAEAAAHRLLSVPYWGSVSVNGEGNQRVLCIGTEPVLSVTSGDASDAHISLGTLASNVASQIQEALDQPPLRVSDNFVQVPLGHTRSIKALGPLGERALVQSSDKNIATVTKTGKEIAIKGMALGTATILVTAGNLQENVEVKVQPFAAVFPQGFQVEVAGAPAGEEAVRGAAEGAIKTRLQTTPDAQVSFKAPAFSPLPMGKSATYTFEVSVYSATGVPNKGPATVTVTNVGDVRRPDDYLWYSNKPENVKQFQSLFASNLKRGNGVRLLYHHLNGMNSDMYLRVEAVNDSTIPAQIAITPGDCKPVIDPVNAGIAAACQFVRSWMNGTAEIVTIPPGAVLPISFRRLSPGETASGLCELRLISGPESLLVRTDSLPPLQLESKWANVIFTSTPWHEVGSHPLNSYDNIPSQADVHVYAAPYQLDEFSYAVGGRFGFFRIGQHPLSQVDSGGSLDGNYGVFDTIDTTLSNPTAKPADVELVFMASAGYAAAVFLVNGEMHVVHELRPNGTEQIAKYHLEPNQTLKVSVVTVPVSGSSYPATLIARAISDY